MFGPVLWLERPPVLRWAAAALLVLAAAWSEFAPQPTVPAVFLATDVEIGTPLDESHVTRRRVPAGVVDTIEPSGVAAVDLHAGEPLVYSMVATAPIPSGWLLIEAPVPGHAPPGAEATGVILGGEGATPVEFPALVIDAAGDDPFGGSLGTLAVPPEWIGAAAAASASGRLVIGVQAAA